MPFPTFKSLGSPTLEQRSSDDSSRKASSTFSVKDDNRSQDANEVEKDANITPTMSSSCHDSRQYPQISLPQAARPVLESSVEETESNRLSFSSLYSLGSVSLGAAKGKSAPSSTTGSEAYSMSILLRSSYSFQKSVHSSSRY